MEFLDCYAKAEISYKFTLDLMTSDSDPIQNKYSSRGFILSTPVHLGSIFRWRESKGEIVDFAGVGYGMKTDERH